MPSIWLCGGFDLALGGFARLFEVRSSRFKVQGSVALNIADSCPVVFQAGLKAGFCPALASSGPVCPGIALLLAHCLAARPLPPAYGLGDGAKPPENRQNLPVAALHQLWQDGAGMNESEK
jgi:hypothetical protein